jgi:hypothetical protein
LNNNTVLGKAKASAEAKAEARDKAKRRIDLVNLREINNCERKHKSL